MDPTNARALRPVRRSTRAGGGSRRMGSVPASFRSATGTRFGAPARRAFSTFSFSPSPSPPTAASPEGRDPRRFFVGAAAVGHAPPPRDGIDAPASPPPAAPPPTAPPGVPGAPVPGPDPVPSPQPAPSTKPGRRRWWQRKRNWILLICVVLPFLLIAGGLIYADIRFRQIHRVPVGSLLDSGGSGTNILIVGSDSRGERGCEWVQHWQRRRKRHRCRRSAVGHDHDPAHGKRRGQDAVDPA